MKGKLSVLAILVCCLSLFIGCSNNQKQVKNTVAVPKAIQSILNQQYPNATVLEFDKEKNGPEVKIQEKGVRKEVSFNTNNEWIYTKWDIRPEDVPVVVMDELASSVYNQYKVKEVDAIEKPAGMFYVFELKMDNNEVKLTFDSKGQQIE